MLLVRLGTHYEDPKQGEIGLLVTFFFPIGKEQNDFSIHPACSMPRNEQGDEKQPDTLMLGFGDDHWETPAFNPCSKRQIGPSTSVQFTSNGIN